jgi:hypothetical protein
MLARNVRTTLMAKILTAVKSLAITTLVLSAIFRDQSPGYQIMTNSVVFVVAAVIFWQALVRKQYLWATAFLAIGIFFTPKVTLVAPSSDWFLFADLIAIVIFAFSVSAVTARIAAES